jgi:hypothetical protein
MTEEGRSRESQLRLSFANLLECLSENDFQIMARVDLKEVPAFVEWVESAQQSAKRD